MITPDQPAAPAATSTPAAIGVPSEALAVEGTTPAVGDEVEFTAKARVTRVEGEQTFVELTAANGQAVVAPMPAAEPDSDDIMRLARKADREMQA